MENSIKIPYPDTDYPFGHPGRCWGFLTMDKIGAFEFIEQQMKKGIINESEMTFIMHGLNQAGG